MDFMIEIMEKHAEHGQDEKVAQDEYEKFAKEAEQKRVTDSKSIADNMIKMNEELKDEKTAGKIEKIEKLKQVKSKSNSEGKYVLPLIEDKKYYLQDMIDESSRSTATHEKEAIEKAAIIAIIQKMTESIANITRFGVSCES